MNIKSERMDRLTKANTLIETIANGGRQFFKYKHRVASFNLDDRQRLWWIDDYTRKPLYLHYKYWYQGFSHGGTLQALVEALKSYVLQGNPVNSRHFGPGPDWICEGDLWGYGEYMGVVRSKALELRIVQANAD